MKMDGEEARIVSPDETKDIKDFINDLSILMVKYAEWLSRPIIAGVQIELARDMIAYSYGSEKAQKMMETACEKKLINAYTKNTDGTLENPLFKY